ncbi:hypothetical protein CXG81DRAFT_17919 [Caulochytrium protostelioides]|uniref:DNA-binding protein RAP1 n=1 Tax=Caulochytrium protostelioides TaxID=1555241 RepID=A0A4P9XBC1_9FUNG|nr:hypothetical protein CXG81DRAFT_17919 [Caulochytrium protostelioides]|eukprot:RKP02391.1 hypothetical protein CXG81DRAFT_17919 [Caulochytrium protostelioides]
MASVRGTSRLVRRFRRFLVAPARGLAGDAMTAPVVLKKRPLPASFDGARPLPPPTTNQRAIFTTAFGEPIPFWIAAGGHYGPVRFLIESFGGRVTPRTDLALLRLTTPPLVGTRAGLIDTRFIYDCIERGRYLDPGPYELVPGGRRPPAGTAHAPRVPSGAPSAAHDAPRPSLTFTPEDRALLTAALRRLDDRTRREERIYVAWAHRYPRHTWQAWQAYALRHILPSLGPASSVRPRDPDPVTAPATATATSAAAAAASSPPDRVLAWLQTLDHASTMVRRRPPSRGPAASPVDVLERPAAGASQLLPPAPAPAAQTAAPAARRRSPVIGDAVGAAFVTLTADRGAHRLVELTQTLAGDIAALETTVTTESASAAFQDRLAAAAAASASASAAAAAPAAAAAVARVDAQPDAETEATSFPSVSRPPSPSPRGGGAGPDRAAVGPSHPRGASRRDDIIVSASKSDATAGETKDATKNATPAKDVDTSETGWGIFHPFADLFEVD